MANVAFLALLQVLAAASTPDGRLLRDARAAQVRFESVRRMHLPRDWHGGGGVNCDARIGRFCYTYDSVEAAPAPESREIVESRDRLIRLLDSAAARRPTDAWIAGQRTRYLLEAHRPDDAVAAARACAAERWWCAAVEGLALHVAERYAAADSLYGIALRDMPEQQRCEWLDLRAIASDRMARTFARAPCAERRALADRLWTLSQPLWSTSAHGNDLRTEHLARLTMAAILEGTANAHGISFGDDSRELLIRYGWAEWFTRHDGDMRLSDSPMITGHEREPSYWFFPDVALAGGTPRVTAGSWHLRTSLAPSRYAPRYIASVVELPHSLTRFARGDSLDIAVAFRVRDTALMRDSLAASLAVLQGDRIRVGLPGTAMLWMRIANDTAIASVEVRGMRTKRVARARYAIDPLAVRGGAVLSDLLLYDAANAGAAPDVPAIMAAASTDLTVSARMPLGVYWEIQGLPAGTPMTLSITVEPHKVGVARRLATKLRLAPELAPVRLRWQSAIRDSTGGQNVVLRLPPRARGIYRVVLAVDRAGAPVLVSSREIEVVP